MTTTEALRRNLRALREAAGAPTLPYPVTDVAGFKKFIGFSEMEALQVKYIPQ